MIGKIVGNYQILNELARGGTGVVYRGQYLPAAREVVLKSFSLSSYSSSAQIHLRSRFRREAFIQKQLDHPSIVRTYEFFTVGEHNFLATEYVPGMSLRELMAKEGVPSPAQAVYLFKQALMALEYAHSLGYVDESDINHTGVIHRGLKPSNLLLDVKGRLKISDFGLGKVFGDSGLVGATQSRQAAGSLRYLAPEQMRNAEIDKRTDLYSLGISMFEMLTGRVPFTANHLAVNAEAQDWPADGEMISILEFDPTLPPSLAAIVMRSLFKDPGARFQTASEFLDALLVCETQLISAGSTRGQVERDRKEPVSDRRGQPEEIQGDAPAPDFYGAGADSVRSAAQSVAARTARHESVALGELGQFFTNVKGLASGRARISIHGNATLAAAALTLVLISVSAGAYLITRRGTGVDPNDSNRRVAGDFLDASAKAGNSATLEAAGLLEREEQYVEAIKVYEEYIANHPEEGAPAESKLTQLRQLASSLNDAEAAFTAGRYKTAVQRYSLAIRLNPESQRAKLGFSRALSKLPAGGGQANKSRLKPRAQTPGQQVLPEKPIEAADQPQLDKSPIETRARRVLKDASKAEDPNLQR